MDILQVVTGYPPIYTSGGVSKSAKKLSEELVKKGHNVSVATTTRREPGVTEINKRENINGVDITRYPILSNKLSYDHKISISIDFYKCLKKNIEEYDIIHTHEFRTFQAYFASKISENNNIPLLIEPRGSLPRLSKSYYKILYDKLFGYNTLLRADAMVFSSSIELHNADQYNPPNPSLIPNGVDLENYKSSYNHKNENIKSLAEEDHSVVLFLSRISERKGLDLLVKSLLPIMKRNEDLTLVVAGPDEGGLTPALSIAEQHGIRDKILYIGSVYGIEKMSLYTLSDVFVLPSVNEYESFGNVVIESLACGTPAIVTNVCGVAEWVDNKYISIVNPDQDEITTALNNHLYSSFNIDYCEVRKHLQNKFSWGSVAEDYISKYKEITGKSH